MTDVALTPPFGVGALLRDWRQRRRRSQLDLALDAGVSARHVSFVETGRSQPSREMVLQPGRAARGPAARAQPPAARRRLRAASTASARSTTPTWPPVREALDLVLRGHEPYPAVVVDRWLGRGRRATAPSRCCRGCAPELLAPPVNVLRVSLHPEGMAPRILNLGEWRAHLLERLDRQVALTGDAALRRAAATSSRPTRRPSTAGRPRPSATSPCRCASARPHGASCAFFSTVATFGTAVDITVAELSIESFFPADAATAEAMRDAVPT